jgi:hypothetical protein
MRALFSKVMTGSMVAGAALMVAACGGGDEAANNAADVNLTEVDMGNDTTVIDATNGTDAMNMSTDTDADVNAADNASADAGNATNGM